MSKAISDAEESLYRQIQIKRLPLPKRWFKFHPDRKWEFDFAWPSQKLAVEVDGGNYSGGRHTRGKGFEQDCEKNNNAVLLGWRVLHFTPKSMTWKNWEAVETIEKALRGGIKVPEQGDLTEQMGLRSMGMGA